MAEGPRIETKTVAEVSALSRRQLIKMILADARERGRSWALGGPAGWSHDELVGYLCRETELVDG